MSTASRTYKLTNQGRTCWKIKCILTRAHCCYVIDCILNEQKSQIQNKPTNTIVQSTIQPCICIRPSYTELA